MRAVLGLKIAPRGFEMGLKRGAEHGVGIMIAVCRREASLLLDQHVDERVGHGEETKAMAPNVGMRSRTRTFVNRRQNSIDENAHSLFNIVTLYRFRAEHIKQIAALIQA
jgi:hypothetical protein